MANYPLGTVKLTWIDANDNNILHSKLFNSDDELSNEEGARNEGYEFASERRHWLIFKLTEKQGNYYKWQLLEYGDYKIYQRGIATVDFFTKPV